MTRYVINNLFSGDTNYVLQIGATPSLKLYFPKNSHKIISLTVKLFTINAITNAFLIKLLLGCLKNPTSMTFFPGLYMLTYIFFYIIHIIFTSYCLDLYIFQYAVEY